MEKASAQTLNPARSKPRKLLACCALALASFCVFAVLLLVVYPPFNVESIMIADPHTASDPRIKVTVGGRPSWPTLAAPTVTHAKCSWAGGSAELDAPTVTTDDDMVVASASLRLNRGALQHLMATTTLEFDCRMACSVRVLRLIPLPLSANFRVPLELPTEIRAQLQAAAPGLLRGWRASTDETGRVGLINHEPMPGVARLGLSTNLQGDATLSVDLHSPHDALRRAIPTLRSLSIEPSALTHMARVGAASRALASTEWDVAVVAGVRAARLELMTADTIPLVTHLRSRGTHIAAAEARGVATSFAAPNGRQLVTASAASAPSPPTTLFDDTVSMWVNTTGAAGGFLAAAMGDAHRLDLTVRGDREGDGKLALHASARDGGRVVFSADVHTDTFTRSDSKFRAEVCRRCSSWNCLSPPTHPEKTPPPKTITM